MNRFLRPVLALLLPLIVMACTDDKRVDVIQRAVAIESSEECHLCGMLIENFPGPKGEFYRRGDSHPQKFCSTRDLFSYLLQPENINRVSAVFVHDMAVAPWDSPDDHAFIDGRAAHYIVDHDRRGAMGPTLAAFKLRSDAEAFAKRFGGRLVAFGDIDLALLAALK